MMMMLKGMMISAMIAMLQIADDFHEVLEGKEWLIFQVLRFMEGWGRELPRKG